MSVPLVCFITWNRVGLTVQNLQALLDTTDDFELYIIDNNSTDDTWEYLQTVEDDRIKCKKRFMENSGVVYAINYALSKRKKDQYFILVENDVYIKTKDWISKFMEVMNRFPEVGLLGGVREGLFKQKKINPKLCSKEGISYYQHKMILGCCNCIRPEVFDYIGYWNEETYGADIDMGIRINDYTPYCTGYLPAVQLIQPQYVCCDQCLYKNKCSLVKNNTTCFDVHKSNYCHDKFAKLIKEKEAIYFEEVKSGKRSIFCASIHDSDSIKKHYYNKKMAEENFQYFIRNAN
ncbi:glycosyltransferase family 2 protein [Vallitalea guaymasensis]|uniref:glycosyltransferase family 2 protein n=1 Tax=Vallitalea guaymasensis TaxID=1185412 RepID=UPI002356C1F3|nr:glycosyltransferase [Vallitalea guaymasensis]